MSKIISINLAIDQLWDQDKVLQGIYSARIPESEFLVRINENLAYYLSESEDIVLAFKKNKDFLSYLNQFSSSWGDWIEIEANPFDSKIWKAESDKLLSILKNKKPNIQDFEYLTESSSDPSVININNKLFLFEHHKQMHLTIPTTKCISNDEIINGHICFSKKSILKYSFGSGGGANFIYEDLNNPSIKFLRSRLRSNKDPKWLWQEKLDAIEEGSVFNFESEIVVSLNKYDQFGLSYEHKFVNAGALYEKIKQNFTLAKRYLFESSGYQGPLGIDFIIDQDSNVYYVDINARMTKTFLIFAAILKLGIKSFATNTHFSSQRFRFRNTEKIDFLDWWIQCQKNLSLSQRGFKENYFFIPYLVTGMESDFPKKEISYFIYGDEQFVNDVQLELRKLENT